MLLIARDIQVMIRRDELRPTMADRLATAPCSRGSERSDANSVGGSNIYLDQELAVVHDVAIVGPDIEVTAYHIDMRR